MKRFTFALGVLLISTVAQSATPKVLIWDLGDTLLKVDTAKALKQFGNVNMPAYMATFLMARCWHNVTCKIMGKSERPDLADFKNHMKELFLNTLSQIPSGSYDENKKFTPFEQPSYETFGSDGKPLPPVQRDYLIGKLNSNAALKLIDDWIAVNPNKFAHKLQRSIFRANCDLYFAHYVDCCKYTKLYDLFKKCYEAKDEQGNRLYTNAILSNWQADLEPLRKKFPEIFAYSDMQVFSGVTGLSKPHPTLFEMIRKKFDDKHDLQWLFIDDIEGNIKAAPKYITGVLVDNVDRAHKELEEKLLE